MERDDDLVDLFRAATEAETEVVAAAIRAQGFKAAVVGGSLTGLRFEAPAMARVMVFRRDAAEARLILRAVKADSVDIDWDQVDLGTREDAQPGQDPPP